MDLDWHAIGTAIVGIVLGGGTALGLLWTQLAKQRAEAAEAKAAKSAADADNLVYTRLTQEVDRLSERMRELEASLKIEISTSRRLERKVARLETFIRSKGFEPPADET